LVGLALAIWAVLWLPACRQGASRQRVQQDAEGVAPVVRGSENGLEVAWWVLTSDSTALANALVPYADDAIEMDPAVRSLWASNGLRLVSVPIVELGEIEADVRLAAAAQRQWLGQAPLWTDAVPGPRWSGGRTIGLDSGPLRLGAGQLRLLTRCWIVPVAPRPRPDELLEDPPVAAMRVELLLQHLESRRPSPPTDPLTRATRVRTLEDEGLVFRRLAATLTLPSDRAVLIVPERPDVDWRSMGLASPEPAAAEIAPRVPLDHEAMGSGNSTPPLGRVGKAAPADLPPAPMRGREPEPPGPPTALEDRPMTLGEALLGDAAVSPAEAPPSVSGRPARTVVVLIPHLPERYRLLP
jgi:hypothetical protein